MNVSLRQLKAFIQIARLHSFTRAAERLYITQAGLSSMIQDLETQLNCRLFDRTTRSVSLTAAGVRFLAAAELAANELEETAAVIGNMVAVARRTLTIAATPLVASSILPLVCREFGATAPNVRVRIIDAERKRIQEIVESGEADVGFGVFFKPATGMTRTVLTTCDLVYIRPCEETTGWDAPLEVSPLPWSALSDAELMGLPGDNAIQQMVDAHLTPLSKANEERRTFNNFQTLLAMVEAGFGGAILPSFVMCAVKRLRVSVSLLEQPTVPVSFFQINLSGRARAEAEPLFVECLLRVLNEHCSLPLSAPAKRPAGRRAGPAQASAPGKRKQKGLV